MKDLCKYATKNKDAIYFEKVKSDFRSPYFRDIDKIIYTLSYARYMDKTQVFSFSENDHVQRRMLHVQYVSKIARTIGRELHLNEDLIEASALGHDLGHTPFGHTGERILNKLSQEHGQGNFLHNVNSIRQIMFIENNGKGINVSMQVMDGILCHNGENISNIYYPKKKTKEDFLKDYNDSYIDKNTADKLMPMTLEGCVVRISDVIAYIGRDIEDSKRMGYVSFEDVPKEIKEVLGSSNSEVVNTIICDVIKESLNKPYIKISDRVFNAMQQLKDYNYKNIYSVSLTGKETEDLNNKFTCLFNKYLEDLNSNNTESTIYKEYLNDMSDEYKKTCPERIVIDFISGMTDDYFLNEYNKKSSK